MERLIILVLFYPEKSDDYLKRLFEVIRWKNDEYIGHGKHIVTNRKVAWYGDVDFHYTYSNKTRVALPWISDLLELKSIIENKLCIRFNSCLAVTTPPLNKKMKSIDRFFDVKKSFLRHSFSDSQR